MSISDIEPAIDAAITTISAQYQLPASLVRAICQIESSFNPWALRYEPGYKYLVGDKITMSITERFSQCCSWGLMQVMGGVAREYLYSGYLTQLCVPEIGILYGCKHLRKLYVRHDNWPDTIASYNAGSPRKVVDRYVNQVYVDKVTRAWNVYDAPPTV